MLITVQNSIICAFEWFILLITAHVYNNKAFLLHFSNLPTNLLKSLFLEISQDENDPYLHLLFQ